MLDLRRSCKKTRNRVGPTRCSGMFRRARALGLPETPMLWRVAPPAFLSLCLALDACVPKGKFDAAVAEGQTTQAALTAALGREKADRQQLAASR